MTITETIAYLRGLHDRATEAPWVSTLYNVVDANRDRVVTCDGSYRNDGTNNQEADSAIIVHTRNLLPELLAIVEACIATRACTDELAALAAAVAREKQNSRA